MTQTKTVLKFGDPESIAVRDKFIEDKEKEGAKDVLMDETVHEYSTFDWICPHCGDGQYDWEEDDLPMDRMFKCKNCKKWMKLAI